MRKQARFGAACVMISSPTLIMYGFGLDGVPYAVGIATGLGMWFLWSFCTFLDEELS